MASTFYADNYYDPMPSGPLAVPLVRVFKYTIGAAFVINDLINLCKLQALTGLVLKSYYIDVPDLDAGATPAITLDLGFTSAAADLIAAATVGQAAGKLTPAVNGVAGAVPVTKTADTNLQLLIHAAPQTGATSGTIKGWVEYFYYGPAITL